MLCFFDSLFFFFKQKTAYEMRISDWSSDVCSSDLLLRKCVVGVNAGCFDWLVEHAELPVEQGIAVTRVGRREDGTDVRAIAVHGATGIGAGGWKSVG